MAGDLLGFNDDRGKLFEIVIQFGAILAVVWEYRERLLVVVRGAFSDAAAQKFILNLFVAFLPLAALLLALVGAWHWRQDRAVWPVLLLAGLGLFLALGRFNPAYWLLARLPGFDLFRAPARWLELYALGVALLAGCGLDTLRLPRAGHVPR